MRWRERGYSNTLLTYTGHWVAVNILFTLSTEPLVCYRKFGDDEGIAVANPSAKKHTVANFFCTLWEDREKLQGRGARLGTYTVEHGSFGRVPPFVRLYDFGHSAEDGEE